MTLEQFEKAKEIQNELERIMTFVDWMKNFEKRLVEVLGTGEATPIVNAIDSKLMERIAELDEEMEAL